MERLMGDPLCEALEKIERLSTGVGYDQVKIARAFFEAVAIAREALASDRSGPTEEQIDRAAEAIFGALPALNKQFGWEDVELQCVVAARRALVAVGDRSDDKETKP